jgi:hypothetical protein
MFRYCTTCCDDARCISVMRLLSVMLNRVFGVYENGAPTILNLRVLLVDRIVLVRIRVEAQLARGGLGRLASLLLFGGLSELVQGCQPVLTGSDGTEQERGSHGEQGRVLQLGVLHPPSSRLEDHGRGPQTTLRSDRSEEVEVASGLVDGLGVLEVVVVGGLRDRGESVGIGVDPELDQETVERSTGHESDAGSPRDGEQSDDDRNTPVSSTDSSDREGGSSDKDDQDLTTDHYTRGKHRSVVSKC